MSAENYGQGVSPVTKPGNHLVTGTDFIITSKTTVSDHLPYWYFRHKNNTTSYDKQG
jgi:hypothetical protein